MDSSSGTKTIMLNYDGMKLSRKINHTLPTSPINETSLLSSMPPFRTNKESTKTLIIQSFIHRNTKRHNEESVILSLHENDQKPFAERFAKFTVREFKNNTRMNIKNIDYANQRKKRERAISYW